MPCRVIVNSAETKMVVASHGYTADKIDIVNPGADTKKYVPGREINLLKKELNIKGKKAAFIRHYLAEPYLY